METIVISSRVVCCVFCCIAFSVYHPQGAHPIICKGDTLLVCSMVCNRSWDFQGNPRLVWHPARETPYWHAQWCAIGAGTSRGTLCWCGTLQGRHPIGVLNGVQ